MCVACVCVKEKCMRVNEKITLQGIVYIPIVTARYIIIHTYISRGMTKY